MSGMSASEQASERGYINALLIPLILAALLLVGAASFGAWAFSSRQDYKLHSDQKAAVASAAAVKAAQADDATKYAEEAKNPLKTWVGPSQFGSISVKYPKTWSSYVVLGGSSAPVNGFFQPDVVPDANDPGNSFALRVQVVSQAYSQQLAQYNSSTIQQKVTVHAYSLPKVPSVIGSRVDGQISGNKQGSIIILPLRNLTLEIWTESGDYENDFNNIILPNMSFSP
jgi:hypothetical protein